MQQRAMVLVFDPRGDLIYACSDGCVSRAVEMISRVYDLRRARYLVMERAPTRPWNATPITVHPLSLMRDARA